MPREPQPFHRLHINITEEQREFLARRAFRERTSMADVARPGSSPMCASSAGSAATAMLM